MKVVFGALLICIFATTLFAGTYSGGSGTVGDPFRISSPANWQELVNTSADWSKYFELTADIDLSNLLDLMPVAPETDYYNDPTFNGIFDGNYHVISNATINLPDYSSVGIFGHVESEGEIRNLGLENITISGGSHVGGLVGENEGTISNCFVKGFIEGNSRVGGLVGINSWAVISTCYSEAIVKGNNEIGGLVGSQSGLDTWARIEYCYASGRVIGDSLVGGILGQNHHNGAIVSCIWNTGVCGTSYGIGGDLNTPSMLIAKNTTEMQIKTTFTDEGWDFSDDDGDSADWQIHANDYPRLAWEEASGLIKYSGGGGIESDPFKIATTVDWQELVGRPEDWSRHFVLTADIDLSGISDLMPVAYEISTTYTNWVFDGTPFTGIFDGDGYTISNFTITTANLMSDDYVGLFGNVGVDGIIKNLSVENFDISGDCYVGGVAGFNNGTITNCYSTGSAAGHDGTGILVGKNDGSITECYSSGTVNSNRYSGGLVGNNYGSITSCNSAGSVTCIDEWSGGLAGSNHGTITDSSATGNVSNSKRCVGGLVGHNWYGSISGCYATGNVTGDGTVGGLVGDNSGSINNSYATGNVTSSVSVGGLVSYNSGTISDCYSVGSVTGYGGNIGGLVSSNDYGSGIISGCYAAGPVSGSGNNVGGLCGENRNMILASFWDINTTGQTKSSGGKGLTTSEMNTLSIFKNAGWGDSQWVMSAGDYPHLAFEGTGFPMISEAVPIPLAGLGTKADPYQIWTAADFALLSWHVSILDKHILLIADLDINEISLYPIGDLGQFVGVFDGNDRVVSNIKIDQSGSDYVGVFSYLGSGAVIKSFGVTNLDVSGKKYVGGLAAYNSGGVIEDCFVTGSVIASGDRVGGLVGLSHYAGTISGCHANVSLRGYRSVGGLVGYNISPISDCHAMSDITSFGGYAGGLVGDNSATISDCYAIGTLTCYGDCVGGLVGDNSKTISNCYSSGSVAGSTWNGGSEYVGGLVGHDSGDIVECYSTCLVYGYSSVGGLNGKNWGASISKSFAMGMVTGSGDKVGGLVGENYGGAVIDCYAKGDVSGSEKIGGLIGYQETFYLQYLGYYYARVENSYAVGSVSGNAFVGGLCGGNNNSEIHNSFWDVETSGLGTSGDDNYGAIGKSTADMMAVSTFTDWDFDGVWRMCVDGVYYPKLAWEFARKGDIACGDGVGGDDLMKLASEWLVEGESVADCNFDEKVNIGDLAVVAGRWLRPFLYFDIVDDDAINMYDLAELSRQWGDASGGMSADVAPLPNGDGVVDLQDVLVLAEYWLR